MEENTLPTVLIADDAEINRDILSNILDKAFNVIEAHDGVEAINILSKFGNKISLVLLDIVMPNLDGYGVLAQMNAAHWLETIPVVIISSESDRKAVAKAYELGAVDYIARPFENILVLQRVMKTIGYYGQQKNLLKVVANELYNHQQNDIVLMNILIHAIEERNGEDAVHIARVQALTELFLKTMIRLSKEYKLTSDQINTIKAAAGLHDIGKLFIQEDLLKKTEKLTPDEEELVKSHTLKGSDLFRAIPNYRDDPLLMTAEQICRWHHERWDGKGYPDGLKREIIPLAAQVVSLADTYDVMVSRRSYKRAYTHTETMKMIIEGDCGIFNPDLITCLKLVEKKLPEKLNSITEVSSQVDANDVMRRVMIHALHR